MKFTNETQQGYENYKQGDPITDDQLLALIENHKNILNGIDRLNDRRFDLFRNQLRYDLESFEGFQNSRKNKLKELSSRTSAMKWWDSLASASKTRLCDINTEIVGRCRRHETLTGREIEEIYKNGFK